jgi:hypothetical protein
VVDQQAAGDAQRVGGHVGVPAHEHDAKRVVDSKQSAEGSASELTLTDFTKTNAECK